MDPLDARKSTSSAKPSRTVGDAPSIGRVERMPGVGSSKGVRKRRRKSESRRGAKLRNARKLTTIVWSSVIMLIALSVVAGAVWMFVERSKQRALSEHVEPALEADKWVRSKYPSPTEDDSISFVKRAIAIQDPELVKQYFRTGDATPDEVLHFLHEMPRVDGKITEISWLSSMDGNGLLMDGVLILSDLDGMLRRRLAILTPDDKGVWKIDYEALARISKPRIDDIIEKKSDHGMVRVIIAKDGYFNGPYKDESQWSCYGIGVPYNDHALLGYCRKGSSQDQAMMSILANDRKVLSHKMMIRATLEIAHLDAAEDKQFEIKRVLAEDWVMGPKAFDEKFK